jgi:phosphatidate cytidylyltransferase
MDDANPVPPASSVKSGAGELILRVASALVLAPLALGSAYVGGWLFVLFWGVAALIVFWEWTSMMAGADRRSVLMTGSAGLALALALAGAQRFRSAVIVLAMGALGAAALSGRGQRGWAAGGVCYAGVIVIAPVVLRSDGVYGFIAILFLFAIVWATDIAAYFAGRAIGGPLLLPRVSPKKTWSGAIAGLAAAAVAAILVAKAADLPGLAAIAAIAVILSAFSQAGDLFESAIKRKFGAKDSGHLIPGHGGLMDRLDGFVAAAFAAVLMGLVRGGSEAPARGLLLW